MSLSDDEVESQVHGWRLLAVLHARIEAQLERVLQSDHQLSVSEYGVLELLSRQQDHHLRMNQLATAMALSQSATTRLVTRLEDRGVLARYLCPTDRRGIYSEVTQPGFALLEQARPAHNSTLQVALAEAAGNPEMANLVRAISMTDALPVVSR
jgi:DNA-binding MarR family transcriptional regulator